MSYNLLKGKKGIIFGALDENSIAWKTAERVHEEGGQFVLTNAPIAMRMGELNGLAEKTGSQIIPADATSMEDLENLVEKSMERPFCLRRRQSDKILTLTPADKRGAQNKGR